MPRKKYDGVYIGDDGIYWVYYNGKRKCVNSPRVAQMVYEHMKTEMNRAAIMTKAPGAPTPHADLIILRGVPGCGKTTYARELIRDKGWFKRVSKDLLRQMLDCGEYGSHLEDYVCRVEYQIIRDCLKNGFTVIVDDTNLKQKDLHRLRDLAGTFHHITHEYVPTPIRVIEFDTPLVECIRRDSLREKPVGAERIREMWRTWKLAGPPRYMNATLETVETDRILT